MRRVPHIMLACLLGGQVLAAQQSAARHDVAAELKDLDRQWQHAGQQRVGLDSWRTHRRSLRVSGQALDPFTVNYDSTQAGR